jgi:hypothetical protein
MFKKYSAHGTVLLAPMDLMKARAKFLFQQGCAFVAQTINYLSGSALMVVVELCSWPFQIAMVVKQLQPPQELLGAVADKGNDLGGTEKTMAVNLPDDFVVALCELHGSNRGITFEAGKTG